jgi:RNA polymerase sigma-70 factor (ECF subfamily)
MFEMEESKMPGTKAPGADLPQISCAFGQETPDSKMTLSESPLSALRQVASRAQGQILAGTQPRVNSSEAGLIQRILGGENEAFCELMRPYEGAVFITARAILYNDGDAEDAAQEAVLKAFINLPKFRGDSKFSTWLIRIATNEALMKLRKERRQKLNDSLDEQRKNEDGDYIPRDFADWREIPSEAVQTKELRQALSRALGSLTPKHREVFVLRDVQHFTIAETAQLLGIRESAVKARLMRARLQMRDALAPGIDGSWSTGRSEYKRVRPW